MNPMNPEWWGKILREHPRAAAGLAWALSLVAGVMAAVVLHYVLYRIGLPSKPFIYVAF